MNSAPTPVVFIPALLCDQAMYSEVIAELGDAIEPHVLLSPKSSLEDSVADLLARAPAQFVLVGTSYGGSLALELALAAPQRVLALWLMGCNPAAAKPGGPDLAGGLLASPDAVIDMLAGLVVHKQATVAATTFKVMARRLGAEAGASQARAAASRQEAVSRLGRLTMPALVLWGQDDPLAPVAVGRALADGLPNAQFQVIEGCGHLPTLERSVECAVRFKQFLRSATGPRHVIQD